MPARKVRIQSYPVAHAWLRKLEEVLHALHRYMFVVTTIKRAACTCAHHYKSA